jgi:hypothetical protein
LHVKPHKWGLREKITVDLQVDVLQKAPEELQTAEDVDAVQLLAVLRRPALGMASSTRITPGCFPYSLSATADTPNNGTYFPLRQPRERKIQAQKENKGKSMVLSPNFLASPLQ